MPSHTDPDSIGIVVPQTMKVTEPLRLASGRSLAGYNMVYETYGELNAAKNNAILICHALSGNHHAAGYHSENDRKPGWWNLYIGPGKTIDTERFFVVCANNLGGCSGSTGPAAINPATGSYWGSSFPKLRVRDWVNSQKALGDYLGIDQWAAVIGGSLGGMQAMRWALEYPDKLRHCIVIASAMKLTAQNLAFNEIARRAIQTDSEFHGGDFLAENTRPDVGLSLARMIGHVTYLSGDAMGQKFGRELRAGSFELGQDSEIEFQVQSYLRHQGKSFTSQFDANTYILMTHALDYFDLAREYDDDPVAAFSQAICKFLVVSFSSDWRFAKERSREITDALVAANKQVSYAEIESDIGHDAFLLPNNRYEKLFTAYMERIDQENGS